MLFSPVVALAEEPAWQELSNNFDAFTKHDGWQICGEVKLNPANPRKLVASEGQGVLFNNNGAPNLVTKGKYRDCEVELEFMIPQKSNSGVKTCGCYEIQIFDSFGKEKLTGSDCGGIYPRGEYKPRYHTIDDGVPPKQNASRPAGDWQTLRIVFRSPRFDAKGEKTANGRFDRVELNGVLIHEKQEVEHPTGAAWHDKDRADGPLLLQGDHGPVAFRKVRVRALAE